MAKRVFNFNKLVRDKIPQAIRSKGCNVQDHEPSGSELNAALKNKIIEEAQEVVESKSVEALKEELADLLEVIYATMSANKINPEEIEKIRSAKNQERGSFSKGIYISSIEIDENNPAISYYTARADQYPEIIGDLSKDIDPKNPELLSQDKSVSKVMQDIVKDIKGVDAAKAIKQWSKLGVEELKRIG